MQCLAFINETSHGLQNRCLTEPQALSAAEKSYKKSIIIDSRSTTCRLLPHPSNFDDLHSSSLLSSSSSFTAAFLAVFFFFLFLGFASLANGCCRISSTSSSVIFLSVLNLDRSGVGGPANLWRPFFVIAGYVRHVNMILKV